MTPDSVRDWLNRQEWKALRLHLGEIKREAISALTAIDANDTAGVARLQAEIRTLDYFIEGEASEALIAQAKRKEE